MSMREHLKADDDERVRETLEIDFRHVGRSQNPEFQEKLKENYKRYGSSMPRGQLGNALYLGDGTFEDDWGVQKRLESGGLYYGYVSTPLQEDGALSQYRFPDVLSEDCFQRAREQCAGFKDRYFVMASTQHFFRHGWELRGFERYLMDLHLNPRFVLDLNERFLEFKCKEIEKFIEAGVDGIGLIGDISIQTGMLLSPEHWGKYFSSYMAKLIEHGRKIKPDLYFYFHSDGNCEPILRDLIDIGVDILNPVQPECMDPGRIKRLYGKDLVLYGTISIQQTLPFGTPDAVRAEVRDRIEDCGKDGGLFLAPSNVIQPDVPLVNIMALYDSCNLINKPS